MVFSGRKQEAALGQSGVCEQGGEELKGDSQSRAPRRCPFLIAAPLCPPQGTLSAGNNSTEVEGKPARPAMQAEPLSSFLTSEPQQRRNWSEGWSQASSKLEGGSCKLKPESPPLVTQQPREVWSWVRVTKHTEAGQDSQGASSWLRAPAQHAVRVSMES